MGVFDKYPLEISIKNKYSLSVDRKIIYSQIELPFENRGSVFNECFYKLLAQTKE